VACPPIRSGSLVPPLKLKATKYLPSFEGKVWEDSDDLESTSHVLTPAQKLLIKRAKINVNILQKESDESAKYELFQRLNNGGSIANAQEIRNCIVISVNPDFYRWMKDLSRNEDFQSCIALNEQSLDEQYDLEILSRFLVLRTIDLKIISNLGDAETFFTDSIIKIAENHNYNMDEEALAFRNTFKALNASLSGESFRRYYVDKNKFSGGFSLAVFETVALGIGYNHHCINNILIDLRERIISLWSNPEYLEQIARARSENVRLPKLISLGRNLFAS
jgi:hypothetical protein